MTSVLNVWMITALNRGIIKIKLEWGRSMLFLVPGNPAGIGGGNTRNAM